MSVDLPAPFSPTSAWTSPAPELELRVVERVDARERLRDALHLDQELTHRGPQGGQTANGSRVQARYGSVELSVTVTGNGYR